MKKAQWIPAFVFLVLLIDQTIKIWVKTHMEYGDEIELFGLDWALIHFIENPGMAFGLTLGDGQLGKLALSLFRILAVVFLVHFIRELIKREVPNSLLMSFALILSGAIGNILDSAFYGLIFSESPYHGGVATFLPEGGGYAGFLQGRVVDMFYFPMFRGVWPEWMPFVGGQFYLFFRPVFNVADVAITLGVLNILLFQRSFFLSKSLDTIKEVEDEESEKTPESTEKDAGEEAEDRPEEPNA